MGRFVQPHHPDSTRGVDWCWVVSLVDKRACHCKNLGLFYFNVSFNNHLYFLHIGWLSADTTELLFCYWFGRLSMVMLLGCFGFLKCLHTDRENYKMIKWFVMTYETWMDQGIYLLVEYSWNEDFEMVDLRNKKF